jgi:hypothetical protein
MMRTVLYTLLISLGCATSVRAGLSREDLMVQTQAADMLGEAIGGAVEHATTKPAATPAAPTTRPAAPTTAPAYRELFDQLSARIRKGDIVDDAALNNLDNEQLFGEMSALQTYNLQQYNRLLRSAGPTTRPVTLDSLLSGPKDSHWRDKRQHIRNAVTARVQAARQRSQIVPAMPAWPGGQAALPPPPSYTWDDPRFHPYYYGPTDALTGWNDPYADPFSFQNGGGVYLRSDTRVNRDYDPRVGGEFDRRINIDYDRRNNIHVDPRQNY